MKWYAFVLLALFPGGCIVAADRAPEVAYQCTYEFAPSLLKSEIQIDAQGKTSVENVKSDKTSLSYVTQLNDQEIVELLRIIRKSGFFTVATRDAQPEPIDGGQSILTISSGGQKRTLRVSQFAALRELDSFFWKLTNQAEWLAQARPKTADQFQALHRALGNRDGEATVVQLRAFRPVILQSLSEVTGKDPSILTLHFQALMRATTPAEFAEIIQKHLPKPNTAGWRAWLKVLANTGIYSSNAAKAHLAALIPLFEKQLRQHAAEPATNQADADLFERMRTAIKERELNAKSAE